MKKLYTKFQTSDFYKKIVKIVNSNGFVKASVIIAAWIIALIPTYLYFIIRALIDPIGFWQEFALVVASLICIGWLQAFLIFFAVGFSLIVLDE